MLDPAVLSIQARMSWVGNICVQWANIEYQVAHIIWWMLDLNMETGKIVTGGLDMQPRINTAILLAKQLGAPSYIVDGLVAARKDIQDGLDTVRNRAVHGITFFDPMDKSKAKQELHRGKGPKTPVDVSIEDLKEAGNNMNGLGNRLKAVFDRAVQDAPATLALSIARKMR